MSFKSIIPQIIYTPFIPTFKKVDQFKAHFKHKNDKEKEIETPFEIDEKSPVQKGYDEHVKNAIREKEDTKSKVNRLIKKSNRRIISIDAFSFVPFGIFTNTIEVEESRVIFIFKQPFTFQSHSVDILDISNVFIESAFFFAKMQIVSRTFIQNDITIGYLDKHKANKVRMIIEGLRTFARAKIDTSIYEIDELIQKLNELYKVR